MGTLVQFERGIDTIRKWEHKPQTGKRYLQPMQLTKDWYSEFIMGNSLVVQWLRLRASTAGSMGSMLGQGTRIPHIVWHGQQTNKNNNQNNPQNNNRIYHEFLWISKEKTNGPVEKWAMIGASILQRRNKWSIKRRCLISLIIRKMQIRPQWESSRMCITGNTYITADTFLYQQNISILFSSWTWAYPVTQHLRKHWPEGRGVSIVAWVTCNLCPGTLVGKLNSRTVILRNKSTKLKPGGCEMNSVDLPAK